MDGNLNMTMEELKKQPVVKEQQTIREHLTQLQTWDVAEGQTLEERRNMQANYLIQQSKELNLLLRKNVEERIPPVQVQQVAVGAPVQLQVPAKQTWKEKRAEKKRIKEAKKIQPLTDEVSAHIMHSIRTLKSNKLNSMDMRPKGTDVDLRVLNCFVKGYRKKWTGAPATEQDAENKEEDRVFINDYCSKDLERRKPHLERIVEELLNEKLDESMMTFEYIEHHAGEVKNKISRGIYFENLYKDPINKPYFDSLPQIKKDLIQHRIFDKYSNFGLLFSSRCNMKGVDSDKVVYNAALTEKHRSDFAHMAEELLAITKEGIANAKAAEEEAVQREFNVRVEKVKEDLMQNAQSMKEQAETLPGDIGGLGLTSYVTGYSFDELAKYRNMIETHPEQYEANKQVVDLLYQEMYKAVDALGDITLNIMASQSVVDNIKEDGGGNLDDDQWVEKLIVDAAGQEQQKEDEKAKQVRLQMQAYADALQGLLRGKEFTELAKHALRRLGYND